MFRVWNLFYFSYLPKIRIVILNFLLRKSAVKIVASPEPVHFSPGKFQNWLLKIKFLYFLLPSSQSSCNTSKYCGIQVLLFYLINHVKFPLLFLIDFTPKVGTFFTLVPSICLKSCAGAGYGSCLNPDYVNTVQWLYCRYHFLHFTNPASSNQSSWMSGCLSHQF